MKDTLVSGALLVAVALSGFYFFNQYTHNKKSTNTRMPTLGTYGYRCGDGTEFTMSPAADMSSIHITPATSVERIPEIVLAREASESGVKYQGGGIVFEAHGETTVLSTAEFKTTCKPMQKMDDAPFNFGD